MYIKGIHQTKITVHPQKKLTRRSHSGDVYTPRKNSRLCIMRALAASSDSPSHTKLDYEVNSRHHQRNAVFLYNYKIDIENTVSDIVLVIILPVCTIYYSTLCL